MGRAAGGFILFSLVAVSCAPAQQADTGGVIAGFAAGGIFGLGAHGSVGGNLDAPISKHFLPFIDFSYSPLTSYAYAYGADNTGKGLFRSNLVDFNGGVKIRFPGKSDWVPYVGFGAGVLHFSTSNYASGFGATTTVTTGRSELAGNASVGALYYFTPHVGFSGEAKVYAGQHDRFGRVTAGIFYQFQ
jgi:hypothetical protein